VSTDGSLLIPYKVRFRMIVFRPFKHEVLTGRITKCTAEGLRSKLLLETPWPCN
jgi:DNA-directed RNA polymerase subunit E'/Rpb7